MQYNSSIYGMPLTSSGGGGGSGVQSVFGRSGPNIFAQNGDYTALMVGADPSGTASGVMVTHISSLDPHTQYALKTDLEAYFDAAIAYFDANINLP